MCHRLWMPQGWQGWQQWRTQDKPRRQQPRVSCHLQGRPACIPNRAVSGIPNRIMRLVIHQGSINSVGLYPASGSASQAAEAKQEQHMAAQDTGATSAHRSAHTDLNIAIVIAVAVAVGAFRALLEVEALVHENELQVDLETDVLKPQRPCFWLSAKALFCSTCFRTAVSAVWSWS
eukprot:TRINITY_DN6935_c0_g1_i7.p1 TRINITY_DN6935_c0_g1~~TRINITY_DN6935_c0_g1_i7.p1  ORF type:complete len:176 (+),score=5.08 TRINITY_DN6935_c0_g1_i7:235-762(+)